MGLALTGFGSFVDTFAAQTGIPAVQQLLTPQSAGPQVLLLNADPTMQLMELAQQAGYPALSYTADWLDPNSAFRKVLRYWIALHYVPYDQRASAGPNGIWSADPVSVQTLINAGFGVQVTNSNVGLTAQAAPLLYSVMSPQLADTAAWLGQGSGGLAIAMSTVGNLLLMAFAQDYQTVAQLASTPPSMIALPSKSLLAAIAAKAKPAPAKPKAAGSKSLPAKTTAPLAAKSSALPLAAGGAALAALLWFFL